MAVIRSFETGATRDGDDGKYDFDGFLSPLVLCRFAQYMHKHRKMSDGELRASDNWQLGLPVAECMKSLWRHFMDLWARHRGWIAPNEQELEESICAAIFNLNAILHEKLRERCFEPKTGE